MNGGDDFEFNEERARRATAHPRAVGSPLPRGGARRPPYTETDRQTKPLSTPAPPRALPSGSPDPSAEGSDLDSGIHRVVSLFRNALPFVQRLLPLLDGHVATAVSNVLTHQQAAPRPAPAVNLAPIQESVTELQIEHRELRDQVIEQNASLKKVEDQLEMVREATDRNTLEQQELMEDLKSVGSKVNVIALVALALLAISVLLNLVLYLHIQRVLP